MTISASLGRNTSAVTSKPMRCLSIVISSGSSTVMATALVVIPNKSDQYEQVVRSTNNIPDAKTLLAGYLNVRDLIVYNKIILPLEALDILTEHLG